MRPFGIGLTDEQRDARKLADQLSEQFESLRQEQMSRLQRYQDVEDRYSRVREQSGIEVSDYGRIRKGEEKRRHYIPLPYEHAITMKHAYRIAGRLPDIVADRLDNGPLERYLASTKEKMLYSVYRHSDAEAEIAAGAQDASKHGSACFDVYWDHNANMPKFRAICPGQIIPIPGVDDPHSFSSVFYFWHVPLATFRAQYGDLELPTGETGLAVHPDSWNDNKTVTIIEKVTPTTRTRFAGGQLLRAPIVHNYGFTPYIIIPNLGPQRNIWGYSDFEFYKDVVAYYESLMSRMADVIAATAGGAYIEKGTGRTSNEILTVLSEGGIAPSRKDGAVEPIGVPEFGTGTVEHLQMMREALNDLSSTPPASWGTLGASSGSDRALQLAPQAEMTALKQINWSAGYRRLNKMILTLIRDKTMGEVKFVGQHVRRHAITPFTITLNATQTNQPVEDPNFVDEQGVPIPMPQTPAEVIGDNLGTQVVWERRLDRDDPEYILAELNKFQQGVQSLKTTLDHLGVENPEDEMKLIEEEADRFPWLRSGMIALIKESIAAQGQGDGGSGGGDLAGGLASLMNAGGGRSGAFNQDAMKRGLSGSANGGGRTQGDVPGSTYGAA